MTQSKEELLSPLHAAMLPLRTNALGAPAILPRHAMGKFKLAGDPALCSMRKWRWCYMPGNVETFRRVLTAVGMQEIPPLPLDSEGGAPWQLLWELADEADGNDYASHRKLKQAQKINHFPGVRELGNKRYLHKNMASASKHFGDQVYDIFPVSFTIPGDIVKLQRDTIKNNRTMYILKVAAKDRGEGIKVIAGVQDLKPGDRGIVQSYVQYPYLLNGYKFTMRVYVVYTSLAPLRLYIYPEGFVHMATEKYSPLPKNINNRYMHLTNPDISKHRDFYRKNPRPFYWSFPELRDYVRKHGVSGVVSGDDDARLWRNIQTLVQKTVLSAEHKLSNYAQKIIEHPESNFELLGLDVLVDENLKPWLIEVNPDPDMSAHAGFELAYKVKGKMLSDLMGMLHLTQSVESTATQFGTKEFTSKKTKVAKLLLRAAKGKKISTNEVLESKYLASFSGTGCNLQLATMACGVKSMNSALLIASSELEFEQQGLWQRLIPSSGTSYLGWFWNIKDSDAILACWENQVKICTKKDRSRK